MLRGTDQEVDYHSQRAAAEHALYEASAEVSVAGAHLALSQLHRSRFELAAALRDLRARGGALPIDRTDKEG